MPYGGLGLNLGIAQQLRAVVGVDEDAEDPVARHHPAVGKAGIAASHRQHNELRLPKKRGAGTVEQVGSRVVQR